MKRVICLTYFCGKLSSCRLGWVGLGCADAAAAEVAVELVLRGYKYVNGVV